MRRLVIVGAALLLVLLAAVFFGRRSLMQGELRAAVEARLSATLGKPVSIGRLEVSLFPTLAVSGGDVRVGDVRALAPALSIERVRILPRVRPLLSGRIIVDQLQLDGFKVSVLRDERGRWHVPSAVPAPTARDDAAIRIERVRVTNARILVFEQETDGEIRGRSSIDDLHADVVALAGDLRLAPIEGRVGASHVSGEASMNAQEVGLQFAADSISDADLPAFLRLLGSERPGSLRLTQPASLSATIRVDRATSRLSGKGTLQAPELVLDPLKLHDFEAPFTLDGARAVFDPATFTLYGGKHQGTIAFDTAASRPGWTLESRLTALDAGDFLDALAGGDQRLDGSAGIAAALRGRVGEPLAQTVTGRTTVEVTDGIIRDFPLLAALGRALRLAEQQGSDTRFSRLSASLAIASGAATTNDLSLQSSDLRVQAAGRIGSDRSLALRGVAVLSPERSASAISSIHELSGLRNPRGEVEVPLTISGTLDAPSFSIDVESVIEKGIADELRRRLRRIIR